MKLNVCTFWMVALVLPWGLHAEEKPGSSSFRCDLPKPALRVPSVEGCSDRVVWNEQLDSIRKTDPAKFESMVAEQVTRDTNFGATRIPLGKGRFKEIYRSSFTHKSPGCLEKLVKDRKVTSIINLYSGEIENNVQMTREESSLFQKFGGKQYLRVLNYDYRMPDTEAQETIYQKVREAISLVKQAPDNVLMHCYGGQHRTGIVFAVIQKCLNRVPIEEVIREYRCHTAWESAEKPGGAKPENEKAIREFPCSSLR
jgi:hypothetical protein